MTNNQADAQAFMYALVGGFFQLFLAWVPLSLLLDLCPYIESPWFTGFLVISLIGIFSVKVEMRAPQ